MAVASTIVALGRHAAPEFEEKRQYPRVVLNQSVQITLADGTSLTAKVHDVSSDAMQIRCDRETASALHPSGSQIDRDDPPLLDISFQLPAPAGAHTLSAQCRLVHYTLYRDGSAALGLLFERFSRVGARILQTFIEDSMEPLEISAMS